MSTHRLERVASVISQIVSEMILRGEIKDPRVSTLVSLSEVSLSKDLGHARIGIAGYMEKEKLDKAVEALNGAAGYIQAKIGKSLQTRLTPRVHFFAHHGIEEAYALTKKIEELIRDDASHGDAPSQ